MRRRGLLAATLAAPAVRAAELPNRPIRLLVGYPAGGGTDILARATAQGMQAVLGQPVVVDNRSGAGGAIAAQAVAQARPDGTTLLVINGSEYSLRPLLDRQVPVDAERDLTPVVLLGITPVCIAVTAGLRARNIAELVALARAQPGALNYASSGQGGVMHLTGALFARRARIELLHVPYRGAGPAAADTVAGQVQMVFSGLPPILPLAADGLLRILAVTVPERSAAAPAVPTLAEAGIDGFDMSNAVGIVAPAGTPAAVIARLNQAANAAIGQASVRRVFHANGADTLGSTPEGYAVFARSERARSAAAITATGVTLDLRLG
jgi:tripartite-type tricarboxylate transporter receptor subunit TctC